MKHQAGYIPVKRKASCLFARIKRLILSADFTIVVLVGEDAEGGNDKMILYTERLILRPDVYKRQVKGKGPMTNMMHVIQAK